MSQELVHVQPWTLRYSVLECHTSLFGLEFYLSKEVIDIFLSDMSQIDLS